MRVFAIGLFLLAAGCADFKNGSADDGGASDSAMPLGDAVVPVTDGAVRVVVDPLVTGRSRIGARSSVSFPFWRSGLAAQGDKVFWVEGGSAPGVYAASASTRCTSDACVQKLAPLSRPSAFSATATHMFVADITKIVRVPFEGAPDTVGSSTEEIVNLGANTASVFWTESTHQDMHRTDFGGATNTIVYSNGTPVAMAVVGPTLFWAGVDISGQLGVLERIGVGGSGRAELSRFSGGFSTMQGHPKFLYYAKGSPTAVHRITLGTGRDETVAMDALGVNDFAIDDAFAYWIEPGDAPDFLNGRVRRVAHDSSSAEILAVSIARPVAVAVFGRTVFVASAGTKGAGFADGVILRLTLSN